MQLLLRTGIQRSKKAPSALHPYGYMKDKFVWSLISAVGIFCLGAGVTVIHGFHNLFIQQQLDHLAAGLTGATHCSMSIRICIKCAAGLASGVVFHTALTSPELIPCASSSLCIWPGSHAEQLHCYAHN